MSVARNNKADTDASAERENVSGAEVIVSADSVADVGRSSIAGAVIDTQNGVADTEYGADTQNGTSELRASRVAGGAGRGKGAAKKKSAREGGYANRDTVMEYARSIVDGRKIACVELTQAAARFLRDLDNPAYEFRASDAEFVIQIIESTIVHVKGVKMGKPFLLEPWEKFICYNIAGFYLAGTDERRFKEAFIFIPRKNGKTPFAASLVWALSLLDRRTASSAYIIANRLDRALESFDFINKNLRFMGEQEEYHVLDSNAEHSISREFFDADGNLVGSIAIQALANNSKFADGINGNLIILDEIHAYRSPDDYLVYKDAMKAYVNKLLVGITTAGKNINSFCYGRLQLCQKILAGTVQDEQYFIFICKADDPNDFTNPIEHEKANPNYGVTIRPQDIMADALQAQNDPKSRNNFLNKSLNIYTNVANAYFDAAEVQASDECYNWTLDELARLPITWTGGADLSVMHDLTAADLYGEYTYDDHGVKKTVSIIISHGFMPVVQAQKKADEDEIPFFWWRDEGWLTLCNGETVDYADVVNKFKDWRAMGFKIKCVAFDKYKSRDFVKFMKAAGFKMENGDQQYWKKSEAFRYLEKRIHDRALYYVHNKAYEYCIGNVKAVEDPDERMRFEKVDPEHRIDLFDAGVIACKQHIILQDSKNKIDSWFN